jgi:uncharacterized repeat protein (TIGR01451 family)
VSGSGFAPGEAVNLAFGTSAAGSSYSSSTGAISTSLTVPPVQAGVYTVTATGQISGIVDSAPFTVTVTAGTPSALTLLKQVTVNGLNPGATNTANPGDQLTYFLGVTNTSSSAASNVTVTDVLQPGQTLLTALGEPCALTTATNTVTCTISTLSPGATGTIDILTVVNTGFSGTISNVAQASATNMPTINSNATSVFVGNVQAPVPAGTLTICGVVGTFSANSVQIAGTTLPLAAGYTMTGPTIVVGANECVTFNLNSTGQAVSLFVTPNLAGVGLVCGLYGSSAAASATTAGTIMLSGVTFTVAPGTAFITQFSSGQLYCFLLGTNNTIVGELVSTPTSAQPAPLDSGPRRFGHFWVE